MESLFRVFSNSRANPQRITHLYLTRSTRTEILQHIFPPREKVAFESKPVQIQSSLGEMIRRRNEAWERLNEVASNRSESHEQFHTSDP